MIEKKIIWSEGLAAHICYKDLAESEAFCGDGNVICNRAMVLLSRHFKLKRRQFVFKLKIDDKPFDGAIECCSIASGLADENNFSFLTQFGTKKMFFPTRLHTYQDLHVTAKRILKTLFGHELETGREYTYYIKLEKWS